MTDPAVYCSHCGKVRNCMMHTRAEFPPDAAKAWMKRHCPSPELCELRYRAGIGPLQRLTGMEGNP